MDIPCWIKEVMLPKDRGEGSYVLRVPRFNVRFADHFEFFKYHLQWPGSWELKEKEGQSHLRDNKARRLTCYLPGCVAVSWGTFTQLQPFRRGQAEGRKGPRWIQASDE